MSDGSIGGDVQDGQTSAFDDLIIVLQAGPAYIKTNLSQAANSIEDTTNIIMSWLEATIKNYFEQGGSRNANPITSD